MLDMMIQVAHQKSFAGVTTNRKGVLRLSILLDQDFVDSKEQVNRS